MLEYWAEHRKENATSEELQNALKILNKMICPSLERGEGDGSEQRRDDTLTGDLPTVAINL